MVTTCLALSRAGRGDEAAVRLAGGFVRAGLPCQRLPPMDGSCKKRRQGVVSHKYGVWTGLMALRLFPTCSPSVSDSESTTRQHLPHLPLYLSNLPAAKCCRPKRHHPDGVGLAWTVVSSHTCGYLRGLGVDERPSRPPALPGIGGTGCHFARRSLEGWFSFVKR